MLPWPRPRTLLSRHSPGPVTLGSRACHAGSLDLGPSPAALNGSCSPVHGPSGDLHMEILVRGTPPMFPKDL